MAKNKLIILIILIALVVINAGYFVWVNYVPERQINLPAQQTGANSPKAVYIEYLNRIEAANTLEDAVNITFQYGYFPSTDLRNKTLEQSLLDIRSMTLSQKKQQLYAMKYAFQQQLNDVSKIIQTVTGNVAVLEILYTGAPETTVKMIKDGGPWKIVQ